MIIGSKLPKSSFQMYEESLLDKMSSWFIPDDVKYKPKLIGNYFEINNSEEIKIASLETVKVYCGFSIKLEDPFYVEPCDYLKPKGVFLSHTIENDKFYLYVTNTAKETLVLHDCGQIAKLYPVHSIIGDVKWI